jgi:hypothetical protein
LEILNKISQLIYEDQLPLKVDGNLCNALICQFQKLKGPDFLPEFVPKKLQWSPKDPMETLPVVTDSSWQLVKKDDVKLTNAIKPSRAQKSSPIQSNEFVVAKGTTAVEPNQ